MEYEGENLDRYLWIVTSHPDGRQLCATGSSSEDARAAYVQKHKEQPYGEAFIPIEEDDDYERERERIVEEFELGILFCEFFEVISD